MNLFTRVTFLICLTILDIAFAYMSVDNFYPFGLDVRDSAMPENDDGSTSVIPISTNLPFFNNLQQSLIVSTNGAISFLSPVSTYTPRPFPLDGDRRLLTPFWGDVDTRKGGTVWYRETTDKSIRDCATTEIRRYFPEFFRFSASWIFIATWDNVAFFGCSFVGCQKRNTFQAILVTDGLHSFTIFNYANITWTTGTASSGNEDTGLGGTPAQVGFNAGDGKVFYAVPSSRTSDIVHIDEKTNVNIPGKFAFRIDSSKIGNGGCNTGENVIIIPRYGPMLGGQYLMISGPCLEESVEIDIGYSNINGRFSCERKSNFSMVCITPMFSTTGDIDVYISIKSQTREKRFKGQYKILNPAESKINVFRHDGLEWSNGRHEISWNNDASELGDSSLVDIHAYTIKDDGQQQFRWTKIVLQERVSRVAGRSYFDLHLSDTVVAIRVTSRIQQSLEMPERGIWSDVFPMVPTQRQAKRQCRKWIRKQYRMPWRSSDLAPCPCTLQQALLDIAKYQPDPDCNMLTARGPNGGIQSCLYRRNANHCVRLAQPREDGSDNMCCYDSNGNLIDARDKEGGTVQRYHFQGGDGNVPYISNFFHDVVPYLQCCRYSQRIEDGAILYSLCQDFLFHRKQSSCKNYVPPRPARTSGDPHITTLDGLVYTFNGVGEFHYLLTMDREFVSQIRFEQFRNNGTLAQASVATAFVARISNTTVEARLNSIRTLDILLNGKQLDIDDDTSTLTYHNFSISYVKRGMNGTTRRKDYHLKFPSVGISFKLYGSASVLNIIPVVANDNLKGKMTGLLGNYDGDKSNDLIASNSVLIPVNSSSQKIHSEFGMTWATKISESIFSYEAGKEFSDYQMPGFTPVFMTSQDVPEIVMIVCKNDTECIFDYKVTGSREIASATRELGDLFQEEEDAAILDVTCEILPSSFNNSNGKWVASNGTQNGSVASFECVEGYYINSPNLQTVLCNNGSWQTEFRNYFCTLNDTYVNETIEKRQRAILNTGIQISVRQSTTSRMHPISTTISTKLTQMKSTKTTELASTTKANGKTKTIIADLTKETSKQPSSVSGLDFHLTSKTATDIEISKDEKSTADDKDVEKELKTMKFVWISVGGSLTFIIILIIVVSIVICYRMRQTKGFYSEKDKDSLSSTGSAPSSWYDRFPEKNHNKSTLNLYGLDQKIGHSKRFVYRRDIPYQY